MIRFSDMGKQNILEDADYLPFIDSDEPDVEQQNKTVTWKNVKDFLMRDVNANEKVRQQAENERNAAEKTRASSESARVKAEQAREDKETGYIAQARDWAVGKTGSGNENASDTNNAFFYAKMAKQYSEFNAPEFHINFDTMELIMNKQADNSNLSFYLDENKKLFYNLNVK